MKATGKTKQRDLKRLPWALFSHFFLKFHRLNSQPWYIIPSCKETHFYTILKLQQLLQFVQQGWCASQRKAANRPSCNLMPCVSASTRWYFLMRSSVATVGKRGREISPSCFCHSQLILSCPPPLCSSSFLAAHRIWPGPSLFSTMMFSRQSDQILPKCLATPFKLFFPPFTSHCYFLFLFHLFLLSINGVSSLKHFYFLNV